MSISDGPMDIDTLIHNIRYHYNKVVAAELYEVFNAKAPKEIFLGWLQNITAHYAFLNSEIKKEVELFLKTQNIDGGSGEEVRELLKKSFTLLNSVFKCYKTPVGGYLTEEVQIFASSIRNLRTDMEKLGIEEGA